MNRLQKIKAVEKLHGVFSTASIVILVHNLGVDFKSFRGLRREIRNADGQCYVTKNTLAKLALSGTSYEHTFDMFSGPTAVISGDRDVVGVSKVLEKFCKDQKMEILGGAMKANKLTAAEVSTLASLPSIDELRGKLIGIVVAPATKLVRLLNTPGEMIARVLAEYSKK